MLNPKISSSHSLKVSLFLFAASMLSACGMDEMALDDKYVPYGGSISHPINVVKGPIVMEVSTAQGSMQPQQINAVKAFAHQAMQAGVTPITVSRPSAGGSSGRITGEIASLIVQQGVPRAMVRIATYSGRASSPVRLSYVSTYAKTLPCGTWEDATDTSTNALAKNHGCAVQANIAAMVADPETLVVPAAIDPIPAGARVTAITTLMKGASSTSTSSPTSTSGAAAAAPTP